MKASSPTGKAKIMAPTVRRLNTQRAFGIEAYLTYQRGMARLGRPVPSFDEIPVDERVIWLAIAMTVVEGAIPIIRKDLVRGAVF